MNVSLNMMRIQEGTSCWDEELWKLQRRDVDYCVFDDGEENPCTPWMVISDDETVTIIRTISMKTITVVKMMKMKIFPWLCRISLCAEMVVGAVWCLMVCYQISHAEHKLSHGIYFVISTEMQPSNSQSYTIFHLHAFPVQEHVSNFPSSSVWHLVCQHF